MPTSPSPNDEFLAAYDEYADAIFRHCYCRLRDREVAVDLMQDTFMKAWEYLAAGNRVKNIRALLYKIANNLIIDHARKQQHRNHDSVEDLLEEGIEFAGESGEEFGGRFDESLVVATLQRVEEPYRTAVVMRYIDELSPKEIGKALNESTNVISVRINRGLKKLKSLLPDPSYG